MMGQYTNFHIIGSRATALKIFLAVAFLLCEILLKISHIFPANG